MCNAVIGTGILALPVVRLRRSGRCRCFRVARAAQLRLGACRPQAFSRLGWAMGTVVMIVCGSMTFISLCALGSVRARLFDCLAARCALSWWGLNERPSLTGLQSCKSKEGGTGGAQVKVSSAGGRGGSWRRALAPGGAPLTSRPSAHAFAAQTCTTVGATTYGHMMVLAVGPKSGKFTSALVFANSFSVCVRLAQPRPRQQGATRHSTYLRRLGLSRGLPS